MRWPWQAPPPPKNGGSERKLVAESRRLRDSMSVMVGRLDVLVERLHQELEQYQEGTPEEGDGDERGS